MDKNMKKQLIAKTYNSITNVLTDHELASLGDTYVNFVYSLALSKRKQKPFGTKVRGQVLAEALRKAGLREKLPSGMTRHSLADAAEALLVYAWLHDYLTLQESVEVLEKTDDPVKGFNQLITKTKNRVKFF